jgi:hypothetical protein
MATVINLERPATRKTGRDIARVDDVEGEAALGFTIRGPALMVPFAMNVEIGLRRSPAV